MDGAPELNGPTLAGGRLAPGCTVKFDAQVRVSHYFSDVGRTFVVGAPLPEQRRIYEGLMEAHERARERLRPGVRVCDVFQAAMEPLRKRGFRRYSRGHFGHSIGLDPKCEEPPFVSAVETRPLEPGMVLSIETPFYCRGLASIQLEDVCLITAEGHEALTRLPRELVAVDVAGS
jgi:Xaa-Pro dipeptidase